MAAVGLGPSGHQSHVELTGVLLLVCQAQLVVLSAQIAWSENVETALNSIGGSGDAAALHSVLSNVEVTLNVLADSVLMEQPPLRRRKLEHLVSPGPAVSFGNRNCCLGNHQWVFGGTGDI